MNEALTWERRGDATVFRFHGSIESEATPTLRRMIMKVLEEMHSDFAIFHLEDATYIDSMGIGMFVNLHVQNHERVKFVFCNLSSSISKAFGYVKLISFFDIRESLEGVLEELNIADL